MENTSLLVSAEHTHCNACNVNVSADDSYCDNCGYPLKGTEEQQKNFITQMTVNEIDLADYNERIRKGTNSLFYVAGAFVLGILLETAKATEPTDVVATLIGGAIICGIFIALGFWGRIKPFAAMVSGACLFGVIVIAAAVANPLTLISGIILKIFVIGCLVKGIRAVMDAEKLKNETHLS